MSFLFTDVEGSSAKWAEDPEGMGASLRLHDQVLRSSIEEFGGYVFTTAGDSFAAAFNRATDAVAAASNAQALLANAEWPGPELAIRIGIHVGEATERDGDYFGQVVNLTARLESVGHGGQTLISDQARAAAGLIQETTDLGLHRLKDIPERVHVHQLGEMEFPHLRSAAGGQTNLPATRTPLVGREESIVEVQHALAGSRLVTVTAVGGVGKTRLAIAVGEAELPHRPDGVWFVDLTALSGGADVVEAVATGVGLQLTGDNPIGQLIGFLSNKDSLIVVDNCEHVVDEVAELIDQFLTVPGKARVLATSREVLDVDGEHNVRLRPLETNDVDSPAVRLFIQRAAGLDGELRSDGPELSTIARICDRLDGMPLAIELAAARASVLSLDELLAGLDDRFHLLTGGRRRQGQRTLEATLDWSYDLLSGEDQRFFRSLGVFLDGFDADAAAAVASVSKREAIDRLETLLAKSLVIRADRFGRARFRLLETLKAYAEDRLVDTGEAAEVRDRHLEHFYMLAMKDGRSVCGGTVGLGRKLRVDVANVSTAAEHARSAGRLSVAAELLTASTMAYFLEIKLSELGGLLARVLEETVQLGEAAAPGFDDDLVGCVRATTVWTNVFLANWNVVHRERALLEQSPHPLHRALALAIAAFTSARSAPDAVDALAPRVEAQLAEGSTLPQQSNVEAVARWMLADALTSRALILGQPAEVLRYASRLLETAVTTDDRAYSHVSIATAAAAAQILLGRPEQALDTVAWLEELETTYYDGTEIRALAYLALGDLDKARSCIRGHAAHGASGRLHGEAADSLLLLAELARSEGDDELACRLVCDVGLARQFSTMHFTELLAVELGVAASCTSLLERDVNLKPDKTTIGMRTIAATRAELERRGWD